MSMKKIFALSLALVMLCAVAAAEVTFTPGTYEGTGEGFGPDGVKATVVLNDKGIESIAVEAQRRRRLQRRHAGRFQRAVQGQDHRLLRGAHERHPVPRLQGFLLPGSDREGAGSGEGGHHGRRLRELRRSEVS